jgi:hypothetical protein
MQSSRRAEVALTPIASGGLDVGVLGESAARRVIAFNELGMWIES